MKSKSLIILYIIFFIANATAQVSSEKLAIDLMDKVRKDLVSMSADFEQHQVDINGRVSDSSTGKVWLNHPNQFKWEYIKPAPQLIVANGEQVWIFDEDLEQVTIKHQNSTANPIYVLLNKEKTNKNYNLEYISNNKDDKLQWVKMTSKIPTDEIKYVLIGINIDNDIAILKLQNQMDNIVVFEFNNIQRNPKLADGFFTFEIPDGIDIIAESAGFGESDY